MSWRTALFAPGNMGNKTTLFLMEAREAHDRITNLSILTSPALAGVWQFRQATKHFAHLSNPVPVRDAILSFIEFPTKETSIRRMDLRESVTNISWDRQRDAIGEMMFLVACSIYENFTSAVQDLVLGAGVPSARPVEKGFQFPATEISMSTVPPTITASHFTHNWKTALRHLPQSAFMISRILPSYPLDTNGRNILDDFEAKMQTFLLFKKFRNTISHGSFDHEIPALFKVVDKFIQPKSLGIKFKPILSLEGGEYHISHYNVIGFTALILSIIRDIDRFYSLSTIGETDFYERLKTQKDAKQTPSADKLKELNRLKKCVSAIGLPYFLADQAAIDQVIAQGAWRR